MAFVFEVFKVPLWLVQVCQHQILCRTLRRTLSLLRSVSYLSMNEDDTLISRRYSILYRCSCYDGTHWHFRELFLVMSRSSPFRGFSQHKSQRSKLELG